MLTTKFYECPMFPRYKNCPDQPQTHIYICRADFLTRKLKVALLAGHLYFTSTVTVIFPGRRRKRLFPCRLSQHMFQNNFNFKAQCSRWYQ